MYRRKAVIAVDLSRALLASTGSVSDRLFAFANVGQEGADALAEIPEATAEISETGAECRQLRHLSQVRIGATPSKEIQQTRQFLIGGGVKRAKERYAWDLRSALTQDFRQFESGCSAGAVTGDDVRTGGLVFDDLTGEVLGDIFDAVHRLALPIEARRLECVKRLIVAQVLRQVRE